MKTPTSLTLIYVLSVIALGLPLVLTFDPNGEGAVFAGLILGAFAIFLPTWFFLALPRRWGMTLFALESISPWLIMIHQPVPTRILAGFILWSLLEVPMYGLELLGLLDRPGQTRDSPRQRQVPTFMLLWLAALCVAYAISYVYRDATPMTQYSRLMWAVAYLFVPLPPLITIYQFTRRVLRQEPDHSSPREAAS